MGSFSRAIAQETDFPLAVFRFLRGICIPGTIFLGNWPKISWPEKVQLRCREEDGSANIFILTEAARLKRPAPFPYYDLARRIE
jgi:hypothetical protein